MKQDKTFYFANFEARDLNQSGCHHRPVSVAAIDARLLASDIPGRRSLPATFGTRFTTRTSSPRSTTTSAIADQFSARYSLYHVESINSRGAGGLSAPTASANLFDTDQTIAASNI